MKLRSLLFGLTALSLLAVPAAGQTVCKTPNCLSLGSAALLIDPAIAGESVEPGGLLPVLKEYVSLEYEVQKAVTVRFVYGIGSGDAVAQAVVSEPVVLVPGTSELIALGSGPIASPWDAFEDPLLGFEDPLLGFEDPLLGFEDPLLGFEDPLLGFEDPLLGLNAIWGTGNVGLTNDYGIVIGVFSEASGQSTGGSLQAEAAILPFGITEQAVSPSARPAASAFETASATPARYALEGNYPNPFNPTTTIRYALPESAPVRLAVYDVSGREVAVLVERTQAAGRYEASFRAEALPSGVYLYRLTAGTFAATGRMLLLK